MELIASFEKSTGNNVIATWAGNVDIKKRIAAGGVGFGRLIDIRRWPLRGRSSHWTGVGLG